MRPFRGSRSVRLSVRRCHRPADPRRVVPASRSSSPDVVAAHWFTAPSSSLETTSRSSAVRPVSDASVRNDSHRLGPPSQGSSLTADPWNDKSPPGCPSWSSAPLQRHGQQGPLHPGLPHPARSALGVSHPPGGLLPCHFATTRAAAIHGVLVPQSSSVTVCRVLRHGEQFGLAAIRSQALRNMRPNASS